MKMSKKILMAFFPLILATAACSTSGSKSETAMQKHARDASKDVSDAAAVIQKMEADPAMKNLLQNSRGVFIVPHYGQAALGVGASGGEGILLVKQGNTWSDPAFYKFGGLSIGVQAGAEGGSLAFILNNEKAVQQFMKKNNFQLSANAGVTVVNWSKAAQAELSRADVVAWSDKKGLFGGAAIGLQDVRFDEKDTSGFYGQTASLEDIFSGRVKDSQGKVNILKRALSRASSDTSIQ
jgi:lipid-binding SYLF domain-containing protein